MGPKRVRSFRVHNHFPRKQLLTVRSKHQEIPTLDEAGTGMEQAGLGARKRDKDWYGPQFFQTGLNNGGIQGHGPHYNG